MKPDHRCGNDVFARHDFAHRGAPASRGVVLVSTVAALVCATAVAASPREPGRTPAHAREIYGADDRRDLHMVSDPALRDAARAVGLLTDNVDLDCTVSGTACDLLTTPLFDGEACSDEPFATQPTGFGCTAFLIAPDLVATAGHCIDEVRCPFTAIVFDFALDEPSGVARTTGLETYRCSEVIESVERTAFGGDGVFQDGADYAVLRLDRPVVGRTPLALRRDTLVDVGDPMVMMGHPAGLPLKVVDTAEVKTVGTAFFQANLDNSGGNSGSPVIAPDSIEVVGILVRGAFADRVRDPSQDCVREARYTDTDGDLHIFGQVTHAALLPVPASCVETLSCPNGMTTATCDFFRLADSVFIHSATCLECFSEARRARSIQRKISKGLRRLKKAARPRTVRAALRQLERCASSLERLFVGGRLSAPCRGALRSVIEEALHVGRSNIA